VSRILISIKHLICSGFHMLQHGFLCWTRPLKTSLLLGTLANLARGKAELVAENALLRQQLIILRRQSKRPVCTKRDRSLLVLLARATRSWRQALLIVQPETLLRWHRQVYWLLSISFSKSASMMALSVPFLGIYLTNSWRKDFQHD
jgi:putative transposase